MPTKVASSIQPIGLDLSGENLRVAQVELQETGSRLVGSLMRSVSAHDEEAVRQAMGEALRLGQFEGLRMATCLPSASVSVHHLRLESASGEPVDEAVRAELAERIDYEVADAEIHHLAVPSVTARANQQEFIVFAVKREAVTQQLRLAEKLGMVMAGITALPLAIGHAFSYLGQRREERDFTFLLVHLEANLTHLVALQNGEMRYARTMSRGVYDMLAAAAKATGSELTALKAALRDRMQRRQESELLNSRMVTAPQAPAQDDLPYGHAGAALDGYVEELLSCIYYVSSHITGREVNKVIFTGPLANDYSFCQLLASRLGLPGQIGDPLAGIRTPDCDKSCGGPRLPEPEISVAIGLSLFGAAMR